MYERKDTFWRVCPVYCLEYMRYDWFVMLHTRGYFFCLKGLGADGLTALNLAIPIYSFVHGSGLMLGMGGATKYSIYRGQGETESADKIYTNTLYVLAVFAVMLMVTGIFFSGKLSMLLGADGKIRGMTRTYLQVILLFPRRS